MPSEESFQKAEYRHIPWIQWLLGWLSVLAAGGFMIAAIRTPYGSNESYFYLTGAIVLSAFLSVYGNWNNLVFAAFTTVTVSLTARYVEVTNRRIYGKSTDRYQFSQITRFKSYRSYLNSNFSYFLSLVLENRKTVKLNVPIGSDKREVTQLIKRLNKQLRTS